MKKMVQFIAGAKCPKCGGYIAHPTRDLDY